MILTEEQLAALAPKGLMNLEEPIPDEFFIFVDEARPVTAHNFRTLGTFVSGGLSTASTSSEALEAYVTGRLNFMPYVPRDMGSVMLTPFFITAIAEYSTEYDADYWRNIINPRYPSRMSAIYAFGDWDTCQTVAARYSWDIRQVKRFRLKPNPLNRVVKVNMEVVSLMRHAKRVGMLAEEDVEYVWRQYWGGQPDIAARLPHGMTHKTYEPSVIWEYLIEGVVERIPPRGQPSA